MNQTCQLRPPRPLWPGTRINPSSCMRFFNTKSLLARYSILSTANLLAAVFGFLVVALLARHFGPAGFGQITLAAAIVSYVLVAATCGLGVHAVRYVASGKSSLESMVPMVVSIRLCLGVLAFGALAACAYSIPTLHDSRYLIFLFGITLFSDIFLMLWVPQAMHRSNINAATEVVRPFLTCYCFMACCYTTPPCIWRQ